MYGVTRILFLYTVFSFLTPPYDVQSWGVSEHMFKHDKKKSWTVPNSGLGVIVFAHNRISRDIRLWEMRFSYVSRYTQYISVYLEIYKYGIPGGQVSRWGRHPETEAIVLEHQMALRQLLLRFWVTDHGECHSREESLEKVTVVTSKRRRESDSDWESRTQ